MVMKSPIHRRRRRIDRQGQPIDLRCRGRTAAAEPAPRFRVSPYLQHLMDELRGRDKAGDQPEIALSIRRLQDDISLTIRVAFGGGSGDKPACFPSPTSRSGSPDGF